MVYAIIGGIVLAVVLIIWLLIRRRRKRIEQDLPVIGDGRFRDWWRNRRN